MLAILQYILFGSALLLPPLASSFNQLDTRSYFSGTKYIYNSMNPFNEAVPQEYIPTCQIETEIQFDTFKFMTMFVGMRGMAGKAFNKGIGGGHWGIDLRLMGSKKNKIGAFVEWKHESLHSFDSVYASGSFDYVKFTVCFGCVLGSKQDYLIRI